MCAWIRDGDDDDDNAFCGQSMMMGCKLLDDRQALFRVCSTEAKIAYSLTRHAIMMIKSAIFSLTEWSSAMAKC